MLLYCRTREGYRQQGKMRKAMKVKTVKTVKGASARTQRARDKEVLSTAAKIINRHRNGRQKYTPEKLAWAYKIFSRRGGETRAKMQTPEQRSELGRKGGIAASKARRKHAEVYEEITKADVPMREKLETVKKLLDAS